MPNEDRRDNLAPNRQAQPSSQTSVTPATPHEGQVGAENNSSTNGQQGVSQELAREFRWVEFAQIGSNVILAIVAIVAVCIYNGQLQEMRKTAEATRIAADAAQSSAQLNWQIMRSANAAALAPRIGTNVADPVALAYGLSISFNNGGKVPAKNFRCEATMARQSVPGYQTIGQVQRIAFSADEVRPWVEANSYGPAETVYGKFDLGAFTDHDIQSIHEMQETVEIQGTFQYGDGFQNIVKESFCLLNLRVHNVAGNFNEGWFPCVEGKTFANETLRYRKQHPETK